MSAATGIEWCDSTFNPWLGCTKVSPGCDHCYAEYSTPIRIMRANGEDPWGTGAPRRRTAAANWREPVRWNAQPFVQCTGCAWRGEQRDAKLFPHTPEHQCSPGVRATLLPARRRVFCASLADVFDNEVNPAWRADLFHLIAETPRLDWLLLTKRIGNVQRLLPTEVVGGELPRNVWLGATIVNQEEADRDVPKLLATDAVVRFLSIEPMLGPVDVSDYLWPVCGWWRGPHGSYREAKAAGAECGLKRQSLVSAHARFVEWVIAGGESGPQARPAHPDWFRSLRDQCAAAGVAYLHKQNGEWAPGSNWPDDVTIPSGERCDFGDPSLGDAGSVWRVGKKAAGRLLDGIEHNGFPEVRHG